MELKMNFYTLNEKKNLHKMLGLMIEQEEKDIADRIEQEEKMIAEMKAAGKLPTDFAGAGILGETLVGGFNTLYQDEQAEKRAQEPKKQ